MVTAASTTPTVAVRAVFGSIYSFGSSSATSLPACVLTVETAVLPGEPARARPSMGAAMAAATPRRTLSAPTRLVVVVVRVGPGAVA